MKYDESDALAVAVCHAFRMTHHNGSTRKSKDWKSFIEAYPEKVVRD